MLINPLNDEAIQLVAVTEDIPLNIKAARDQGRAEGEQWIRFLKMHQKRIKHSTCAAKLSKRIHYR